MRADAARPAGLPPPEVLGFCWGTLVAVIPLFDFLMRPPRKDLSEYNFAMIREAPPGMTAILAVLLLLNVVPVALAAWRCGIDFRQAGLYPMVAFWNIMAIALSLVGLDASATVYVVLVAFVFTLATLLSALASGAREVVRGFLTALALVLALSMAVMIKDGNYSYGRLLGRAGPNYWGMMATTAFFASFAIRNRFVRGGVAGLSVVTVYLCQSRGSMMAVAMGSVVVWLLTVYHAGRTKRLLIVGGTLAAGLFVLLCLSDVILTKLLLVDTKNRGIESGGTGRSAAWLQTIALFMDAPWFGIGYRQHEHYLTAASSSHQAYLASLAETGLFGFCAYLTLMAGGAVMAVRKAVLIPDRVRLAVAGLAVAFLTVGMVERVNITTGSALSLTMIYLTAWAYRSEPELWVRRPASTGALGGPPWRFPAASVAVSRHDPAWRHIAAQAAARARAPTSDRVVPVAFRPPDGQA